MRHPLLSMAVLFMYDGLRSTAQNLRSSVILSTTKGEMQPNEQAILASFGKEFVWGLGTAPTHVEDNLNDSWLDFARAGQVSAWNNTAFPERRLDFWTHPEVELDLAAATGINTFRLGVDWSRLVPQDPRIAHDDLKAGQGQGQIQDQAALEHYSEIINMVRARGLKVMLTLFHHSLPEWAHDMGGWTNSTLVGLFTDYVQDVTEALGHKVDYWNTFNEPTLLVLLTYCDGMWPNGGLFSNLSWPQKAQCLLEPGYGNYAIGMNNIVESHKAAFKLIRKANPTSLIGVAHNVGWHAAYHFYDELGATVVQGILNYPFIDAIVEYVDFVGLNYYGKEIQSGAGIVLDPTEEYSEAGRTVYPEGAYLLLKGFSDRYKSSHPNLKWMMTENGISDRTDILRPAFIIEHLLAVKQAMNDGVQVIGYLHWTISDNWEWKDGYCPKFGLVSVDRADNLKRTKLPSYDLYSSIVKTGNITVQQRSDAWAAVQSAAASKTARFMCRSLDGQTGLDVPYARTVSSKDWRYTGYVASSLSSSASRTATA